MFEPGDEIIICDLPITRHLGIANEFAKVISTDKYNFVFIHLPQGDYCLCSDFIMSAKPKDTPIKWSNPANVWVPDELKEE